MPAFDVPDGYYACRRCGKLVVEGYQHASIQTCTPCVHDMRIEARDPNFVFEVEGREFKLKPMKRGKPTPKRIQTLHNRMFNRASMRAVRRLKLLYNPMYQLLIAEEKAKIGLDPVLYWSKDTYSHTELRDLLRERDELMEAGKAMILSHDAEDRAS